MGTFTSDQTRAAKPIGPARFAFRSQPWTAGGPRTYARLVHDDGLPQPPAGVLLDLDGTLVATEPLWSAVVADVAARHGARWEPEADDARLVGILVPDLVELLRARGVSLQHDDLREELVDGVARRLGTDPPWRPGALALLAGLVAAGIPTALVTTSDRRHAEAVAAAAPAGALGVVVSAQDVTAHKPDPAAYLLAARRLRVEVSDCVAVEDSVPGVAAALASGAWTLAIQPATVLPEALASHPRLRRLATLPEAAAVLGLPRP